MNIEENILKDVDPEIYQILKNEEKRQSSGLELIASENYCSRAVMIAQGSVLTNKYAEGYPGKRYYDGCEFVDQAEALAIERIKKLFGAKFANVQPHSGSSANMAVYFSVLNPGDKILGMDLSQGGHLTHGSPVNFSGKIFKASHYGIDPLTEKLDYDHVMDVAKKEKPQMIIAGASAYPREIDFSAMKEIATAVGAYLTVDMAHIAGLVAAGLHNSPVGVADFVTSTTHKTLKGPRGGIILTDDEELAKKINSNIFPGIQGGPLEHVIAAKAVAFKEALSDEFKQLQKQTILNAKALAQSLQNEGIELVSGGTDNHLILMKTLSLDMSGKEASTILEGVGITCNKNMIPGDARSPFVTSGVRLGTPALSSRGMKEEQMTTLGKIMAKILKDPQNESTKKEVITTVQKLCQEFPIYE